MVVNSNLSEEYYEDELLDMKFKKYKQFYVLDYKDKEEFRNKWWKMQDEICPILKEKIPFNKTSIDHKHKRISDEIGGKEKLGLVRAILHLEANSFEGKIINQWERYSLKRTFSLPTILRNIADYYEMIERDEQPIPAIYIYPGEEPKEYRAKLGKREYAKVIKYYFDVYPKRKVLPAKTKYKTKEWEIYISDVDNHLNLKQKNKKKRK